MTKTAQNNITCAATAMVVGGMTFAAAKALTNTKAHTIKKATGKAIKAVGSAIEMFAL